MAVTSSSLTGNAVSNITQTSVAVTFGASVTGTSIGATEVVFITSGGTQYGGSLATMASIGTTSTTRTIASAARTITGLSASTTYTGALHLRGVTTQTDIRIGTSFTFTTASPPQPVSQNYGPSLSGTGISGDQLSATAGSYNNASTVTTRIAYNTSGSFSGSSNVRTSPYTVTDADAASPPYYFAATDIVLGTNGTTYYFYSSATISRLKVSFDARSGTAANPISYIANASSPASIQLPPTSRTGYTFNGWFTAASGGTNVGGTYGSYTPSTSASVTLYAQWTAQPVSQNWGPSLSGTGVAGTSMSATAGSYNYAASVTTTIAYSTNGLFSNAMPSYSTPHTVSDFDATYVPYYFAAMDTVLGTDGLTYYYYSSSTISKLKASFDSQGGTSTSDISYIAASPANYIQLPYTSRTGYSFNGWYTASSGGTRAGGVYDGYQPSTSGSIILYAQWTLTPISQYYTPSIYGSGTSGSILSASSGGYANGTLQSTRISYNVGNNFTSGTTIAPNLVQNSPYTVTDSDAEYPPFYFAAVDTVRDGAGTDYYYYSSSIESNFKITYVYGNGSSDTYQTFYSLNPNNAISLPTATRYGYTFNGWYTASTGGSRVTDPYTPSNTNITLYAQWTPSQYTLTYDANGGNVSPVSKVITYNEIYDALPTPSRTGYTFIGWYIDQSFSSQVLASSTYTTAADSSIYAKWQGNAYVVSLYPNYPIGGTSDPVQSTKNVNYDSQYGELPTLTRTGYTFDGWYTSASGGTRVVATTLYSTGSNTNLFAHWTASTPVFSDQSVTTTAHLNQDINTLIDHTVTASPVTSYSIVYSGSGLDPTSWISIAKESGTNNGILSGKPPQIGIYTFTVRANNSGGGDTDSGLITLTVYPSGKRSIGYSMTSLTTAKRFTGSAWVDMKVMKRFDGTSWQDISNI